MCVFKILHRTCDPTKKIAKRKEEKKSPNYHKADLQTIRSRLEDIEWISILRGRFSDAYIEFEAVLERAIKDCIPNKGNGKKRKGIYLTTEAVRLKDKKNKLWRRYKKSGMNYDLRRFRQAKNNLRTLTRRLRLNFERDIAEDSKRAPKKFWSYVKSRTKTRSKGVVIFNGEYPPGVFSSEKPKILRPLIFSE